MSSFLAIDGHFRSTIIIILSGFYLNKHDIFSIYGDNINFLAIGAPIPFKNLIALIFKKLSSQVFSNLSQ